MPISPNLRELLLADLAVARKLAKVADVAAAMQRAKARDDSPGSTLIRELARAARIDPDALALLESEADRLIEHAGGDVRAALDLGEGPARTIHGTLGGSALRPPPSDASLRERLRPSPDGRYRDFIPVGEGGMGVVYLALDTEMNRLVALKTVRTEGGDSWSPMEPTSPDDPRPSTDLTARFLQEAWVTGGLEHPGVVPVYELGRTPNGVPYYTMRFVRGQRTLREELDDLRLGPVEDRLRLLEPFLKLCDTLRYAHSRGIVHRDLKPDNVALGEFGEVVLLDWGLAKVEGQEDISDRGWQEGVLELRQAEDLRTRADAIGTPGYMSPEAALGRLEAVGPRSDLYGLGVILYEILTGRLPYEFRTHSEYVSRVMGGPPPEPTNLAADTPEPLSRLCARCLSRDPDDRPADVDALASAIRSWQAATAVEREVEGHLRDARVALAAAESAAAGERVSLADRAAAALHQVASSLPDHVELAPLEARARTLRELAIRERERASAKRLLFRGGVLILVLATIAGFVIAAEFEAKARERERTLDRVLRLSDAKKVRTLLEDLDAYSLSQLELVERTNSWFVRAAELTQRLPEHERALELLRSAAIRHGPPWEFVNAELAWRHQVLSDLVASLRDLDQSDGVAQTAARRYQVAAMAIERSLREDAELWRATIEAISNTPVYRSVRIVPQRGLVPLGKDPDSGLFEFAHIGSGGIPSRDFSTGRLRTSDEDSIVLVLLPGGRFLMGGQSEDPDKPNYWSSEGWEDVRHPEAYRLREEVVGPFFVAKTECTQAQWRALTGGQSPAFFGSPTTNPRHPVEQISWEDCDLWLPRNGLRLPTQAQWEYACRAGTTRAWWTGAEESKALEAGWFQQNSSFRTHDVGLKLPNPFGLHDVHGNVWEWCADVFPSDPNRTSQGPSIGFGGSHDRALRGASWYEGADAGRCPYRNLTHAGYRCFHLGVRPARALETRKNES